MTIPMSKQGDRVVAGIPEQLTVVNRESLKQQISDELQRGGRKFVFDFAQTGYIDSSGLGVLVTVSKAIRDRGGELRLVGLNQDLSALFEVTRFDTLFDIGEERS